MCLNSHIFLGFFQYFANIFSCSQHSTVKWVKLPHDHTNTQHKWLQWVSFSPYDEENDVIFQLIFSWTPFNSVQVKFIIFFASDKAYFTCAILFILASFHFLSLQLVDHQNNLHFCCNFFSPRLLLTSLRWYFNARLPVFTFVLRTDKWTVSFIDGMIWLNELNPYRQIVLIFLRIQMKINGIHSSSCETKKGYNNRF